MNNTVKGFFNRWVSATSFGLIPLFSIPVMAAGMQVPSVMVYRFAIGCLGILAVLLLKRTNLAISLKQAGQIALLALFYDTEAILMILGYDYIPSGIATTLVFSYPIWTEVLMLLFFHEKFSWSTILALVLAIAGVAMLSGIGSGSISMLGVGIELLAGLSYSFYLVAYNQMGTLKQIPDLKLTFWIFVFGLVFFIVFSVAFSGKIQIPTNSSMLMSLIGLGIVCTALSNVALIPALKQIGATMTAILGAFEPLTAMIVGILVFGDSLTITVVIGFAFIIGAVLTLIVAKMKKNRL